MSRILYGAVSALALTLQSPPPVKAQDAAERLAARTRVSEGFRLAPVALNLRGLDKGLVGLGSYLVNGVGGCNDCHTSPPFADGGDPFKGERKKINVEGYLAGGVAFGPVISSNLTPDERRRPGGLTQGEFRRSMRRGIDADDPGRLLQVMPWPVYSGMTDRDLAAIYEYLKAIPSLEAGVPPAATSASAP